MFRSNRVVCSVLALACFVGFAASIAARAQGVGVLAHTIVTAEPHKGSNLPVINKEDVLVYEGRDRDTVTDWVPAQGDHAALEFFILIDDSSSTSIGTQLQDIRHFIENQPPSARIGLAYMQNGTAQIVQDLTADHALVAKALRLPMATAGVSASPYFSLSDLVKKWPASNARHEVLMVTSGIDLYYGQGDLLDPYLDAAISDAQRAGIIVSAIYTPGMGHFGHDYWLTYWGQLYLARLADQTGGESYYIGFTGAPVDFTPYLDDVTQRMNHQYLLAFLAKQPKKAGLVSIKVRTEVPKVDLVAPRAVYVGVAE